MLRLIWQKTEKGARILRAEASCAELKLPDKIEGKYPITEIGDYCFSSKKISPQGETREAVLGEAEQVQEISGASLKRIFLPDTVEKIGNLAFYNCTNLEIIRCGAGLTQVGSDAFMNCSKLRKIKLESGIGEATGLKQMLGQLSGTIEAEFEKEGKCEAKILYPEYAETYDEISPAHIFGRNIQGEGFRARQCFKDGKVDFRQYDTIFSKVCAEEEAEIRIRIAVSRLRYPADLSADKKMCYEAYLLEHADKEAVCFLQKQDKETLLFLCEKHYLSVHGMELLIQKAAQCGQAELAATLMRAKADAYQEKGKDRYAFDAF